MASFILIDDTHDQLVGGLKEFNQPIQFTGITPAPVVSAAGKGKIYWDPTSGQFMHSDNGGPWMPFAFAMMRGTATFPGIDNVHVTLSPAQPDANYFLMVSAGADEVIYWANKAFDGFDLISSNGASIADVDWALVR